MRVKGDAQEVKDLANCIKDTLQRMIYLDSEMSKVAKKLDLYVRDGSAEVLKDTSEQVGKQLKMVMNPCFDVYKSLKQYSDYLFKI